MKSSQYLALLSLLALATRPSSQGAWGEQGEQVYPCLPFQPENRIDWPATGHGSASAFGRAVVLELNGDLSPDGVVVAGGVAVALFDAAYYDQLEVVPGLSGVTDIAALPVGGEGEPDRLLVVDAEGLSSVVFTAGQFGAPQVLARGPWIGARTLHVDDLDGDGLDDVVGINASGLTVHTRTGNAGSFPAGPTYSIGAQAYDALSIDWDNDGLTRELAVVAADGLHVYTPNAEIAFEAHTAGWGCITRVRSTDITPGGEFLAWARPAAGGGAELVVRGARTEAPEPLYFTDTECPIQSFVPTAMLAGQYDDDDDDDLLLVRDGTPHAIVLRNIAFTPGGHFDPADNQSFDIVRLSDGSSSFTGVGIPAFAQLDLDGPADVLCPVKGTDEVLAFRTLPYFRTPFAGGQVPTSDAVFPGYSEFEVGQNGDPGWLRLAFKVLGQYENHDRVLLKLWIQEQVGGVFQPLDGEGFYRCNYDLLMDQSTPPVVESEFQWIDVLGVLPTGTLWNPQTHFYVELRFQRLDSNGAVLQASPKFFGGFTLPAASDAQLNMDYFGHLLPLGIPGSAFALYEHNHLTPEPPVAETLVGAYVPMNSLPDFGGPITQAPFAELSLAHLFDTVPD